MNIKIYQTAAIVNIAPHTGDLLLSDDQARRRRHLLTRVGDAPKLKLDENAEVLLGDAPRALYRLLGTVQFKAGEVIGYSGELNKALASLLVDPDTALQQAAEAEAQEPDEDEELIAAIDELEPDNGAHFNSHGKPQLDALGALVQRKVTGKERDAAWQAYQDRQANAAEAEQQDDGDPDADANDELMA